MHVISSSTSANLGAEPLGKFGSIPRLFECSTSLNLPCLFCLFARRRARKQTPLPNEVNCGESTTYPTCSSPKKTFVMWCGALPSCRFDEFSIPRHGQNQGKREQNDVPWDPQTTSQLYLADRTVHSLLDGCLISSLALPAPQNRSNSLPPSSNTPNTKLLRPSALKK